MPDELTVIKSEPLTVTSSETLGGGDLKVVKSEPPKPGAFRRFIDRTPLAPLVQHAEGVLPAIQSGDYGGALKHVAGISTMGMSDMPDIARNVATQSVKHLKEAHNAPTSGDALRESLYAVPFLGGTAEQAVKDYNEGNYMGLAGTGASFMLPAGELPAVKTAGRTARTAAQGFKKGASGVQWKDIKPVTALGVAGTEAASMGAQALGAPPLLTHAVQLGALGYPVFKAGMQGARQALKGPELMPPPVTPMEYAGPPPGVPVTMGSRGTFNEPPPEIPVTPAEQAAAGARSSGGKPAPVPSSHPLIKLMDEPPPVIQEHGTGPGIDWNNPLARVPADVAPAPPPVAQIPGKGPRVDWKHPLAKVSPDIPPVTQVPGSPAPLDYNHPLAKLPDEGLAPAEPGVSVEEGIGRIKKLSEEPQEPPNIPPIETVSTPARYAPRNNPKAAHNVDVRIATALREQGIRPEDITLDMINGHKTKLGHLRATPQLEDVRQTMRELGQ